MSDTSTQGQDGNQDPANLRKQLNDSNAARAELARQVANLTGQLTIHSAGLGHLSEAQRNAMIFTIGDGEVNADSLKGAAQALGFPLAPSAPTTPPTNTPPTNQPPPQGDPNANVNANGDGQGDGQPPIQFLEEMPGSPAPDPMAAQNASIAGLTKSEYASVMAGRGGTHTGSFEEALAKAGSKKEVLAVIRQLGAHEGLVLDTDLI